jgi:hypothetical protein
VEKWLCGCGILNFVLVLIAIAASNRKTYYQQFAGQVIGKEHREVTLTTGMRHDFVLVVRRDDAAIAEVLAKASVYNAFSIGDRIVKQAGDRWPTKPSDDA